MTRFEGPKGLPDILPPRSQSYEAVVRAAEDIFARYGYRRIETPTMESTDLFVRGVGESTDIVNKEMYTFQDKGKRSLTLRPEGTAPVMRAVIEHGLHKSAIPVKLYYVAEMFRQEKPQKGRYRQHTQVGVEAIGSEEPSLDAEVIDIAAAFFKATGVEGLSLKLNSIGHLARECRTGYLERLVAYLDSHRDELDPDCRRRMQTNPLRTFDCKVERDQQILAKAPMIGDSICDACRQHFSKVRELIEEIGIEYEVQPSLVRGFDYYTRTTFEFQVEGFGAQNALGGGGRYDGLAELVGGKHPLPGIGFGLGVDRTLEALEGQGKTSPAIALDVYVVAVTDSARGHAFIVATELRRVGISSDLDHASLSVRSQFKSADRAGARFAVVIGEKELEQSTLTVRDMGSGAEEELGREALISYLSDRLSL